MDTEELKNRDVETSLSASWRTVSTESELVQCQEKSQEYLGGWQRAQADFINYKKDEGKRMAEFSEFANRALLLDIIEALDTFDIALKHVPSQIVEEKNWLTGLKHGFSQMDELLKRYGIERIQVEGKSFDPHMHEGAVAESEGGEPVESIGSELESIRAGYILNGKVIRPARVKIIK